MKRGIVPTHEHTDRMIAAGYSLVAGVDEVGRGALAGPVVAAAVILAPGTDLPAVRDSKLVRLAERERLAIEIKCRAVAVGIGWATAGEIDERGLTWAVAASGKRALEDMNMAYDAVILDGNHNYLNDYCISEAIIKADSLCLSVAAASIVAKVARDNVMNLYHQLYPQFGFNQNVGYGTALHMSQLRNGISSLHRRSFAPIKALLLSAS
jgi:ribonuclease HII